MRTYRLTLVWKDKKKGTWNTDFVGHHQGSREGVERRARECALRLIGVSTRWRWGTDKGQLMTDCIMITDVGPGQWGGDYTEGKLAVKASDLS